MKKSNNDSIKSTLTAWVCGMSVLLLLLWLSLYYTQDSTYEQRVEKALTAGNYEKAKVNALRIDNEPLKEEWMEKIFRLQISTLFEGKNIDAAYQISQEEKFEYIFFQVYIGHIIRLYNINNETEILQYLSASKLKHEPDESSIYNDEVFAFNSQLEPIIAYFCVNDNKAFALKLLAFIKPTCEKIGKDGQREYIYTKQSELKEKYDL